MLDPKIAGLARPMIQVQFDERRKQVERDIGQVASEAVMAGAGRSGILIVEIREICAREVGIRALLIWQALVRVMSNLGVEPDENLAAALKNEVENYSPRALADLTDILNKNTRNIGCGEPEPLESAWGQAMRKVYAEIDLFVASLFANTQRKQKQPDSSRSVFNFYSPVGVFQTGAGATAGVTQIFGSQEQEALIRALDLVKQNLINSEGLAGDLREEMLDLIEEGQTEVKKPKPNGMRIQSVLMAVATTIQTVGSLQPAYQALKAALLPLGIFLP